MTACPKHPHVEAFADALPNPCVCADCHAEHVDDEILDALAIVEALSEKRIRDASRIVESTCCAACLIKALATRIWSLSRELAYANDQTLTEFLVAERAELHRAI